MAGGQIELDIGGFRMLAETAQSPGIERTSSARRVAESSTRAFEHAQEAIIAIAVSTAETIRKAGVAAKAPEEVSVSFGLKFSGHAGVLLAAASTEASLAVTLVYRRNASETEQSERSGS